MKEINLPITTTYSLNIKANSVPTADDIVENMEGICTRLDVAKNSKEVNIARKNGGHILYATTSLEQKIERLISLYIFGLFDGPHPERSFFEHEILESSALGFNFKKQLLKKLIHEQSYLRGKKKNEFERMLSDIIKWRNAFAHGKLCYDDKEGCLIKYYSGDAKKLILNDSYWNTVTFTFEQCDKILSEIQNKIEQPLLDAKYTKPS